MAMTALLSAVAQASRVTVFWNREYLISIPLFTIVPTTGSGGIEILRK
jgi:hypothetical protein